MKFWTEATPLAKLRLIAFLIVGLTAVHAAFLLYSLYRSEELLARATSVLVDEARIASRRPLLWMLGAVPFGFILAALVVAQVRRIGGRTERIARLARRMAEGDVAPSPVDPTERDELVEVERALNEMAAHIAVQGRRQAAQHAATRVLAESETLGRAMPAILKAICDSLGWHWSALWTSDREKGVLRCGEIWHAATVQLADFSAMSQGMTFAAGVGLPGRVWASGQSAWITDVQADPNFPRLPAARKVGLHGAFCFPIPTGGGLIGVMEFLSVEIAEPDPALLAMMDAIGTQIGQFVERTLTHERSAQKAVALSEAHRRLEHDFAERTEAGRRLMAQHAATRALEESASLDDAAPRILEDICEALGWAWSALWVVDPDPNVRALREVTSHSASPDFSAFEEVSRGTAFESGVGLPGRAWSTGRPAWSADVTLDPNFPRAPIARQVGLRGAFAFPIWCEGRVLGVMEFFSRDPAEPDEALLAMMGAVGSQIGQFIERKHSAQAAEEALKRSQALLQGILPAEVAQELETTRGVRARHHEYVAVLFCDIDGFAAGCEGRDPEEAVARIQELMEAYERLADEHGLLTIKSLGPGLMAVCGLLRAERNPVLHAAACALELRAAVAQMCDGWSVRIGIHAGPATAGLLGRKRIQYDVWGDTVDLAARLHHHDQPGAIALSDTARIAVARYCDFEPLGSVALGPAQHEVFRLTGWKDTAETRAAVAALHG
ncbi:MAG: GAF domain-containing protein [Gammaproteobacteria bacterium]